MKRMGSKDVQNHIPWPLLFFPHPRPHLGKSYLECPQFPSVKTKVCREAGGSPGASGFLLQPNLSANSQVLVRNHEGPSSGLFLLREKQETPVR